ncbi:aerobic-type carbon monoxide dehydrogenase, middle subunit CoxM/CutM-like protein [Desulfosporosinus orientis DSM 765]|uniref:Aerobic-type carbon monoxide dehydrogenase, middle subunit CoxM/CutM-like protein n=1 Tax=Desulfosporosinus orientis (strain ATCC 19365 / DSM 765 / NCIMB 8382 / VKM B-1628 / Singapore I) TaxID=768706 RepID=G7WJL7_DESOD|nr:FAD binding domain-containing protein [Desulfosporosinus orientis]AET70454.1 aerobic-type carbon monoxide dehydrogenase, middle subunit CoxM/CutM-like protein [Desulfosporosinus orientis DSM 765]
MPECQIICPSTVAEGIEAISRIKEDVVFLGGGTDLVIKLQSSQRPPAWLMDLSLIPELRFIKEEKGRVRIGSGTTFFQISESLLLREKARCLSQAASQVGSVQIRNRATIGGNIANASPAGDSLPALLALEAWVSLIGPQGARRVPFAQLQAKEQEGLKDKELITEIDFPIWEGRENSQVVSAFGKIGSRTAVSIARLNMAAVVEYDEEQMIRNSKWAVGALGLIPFRLPELERELGGKRVGSELAEDIARRLTEVVDKAIPGRASQGYKREAVQGLVYDLFGELFPDQGKIRGEKG